MKGTNSYKASLVKWFQIPGRTLEWAKNTINRIGITKFLVQYEMNFNTTANQLLLSKTTKTLNDNSIIWKPNEFDLIKTDNLITYNTDIYFNSDIEIDFG